MASKSAFQETQRAKLERKEQAILAAAHAIFVDHGFDGAKMSEIAKRAGIGEGTIYSYYDSKAELMLAVLQQFWDGLTREARQVMADVMTDDIFEQIQRLASYHLDAVIRNVDFINLSFALRRTNSEVSVSRDHLRQYVAVFDEIFRRGQDRGVLRSDAVLWQARDVFYGTLEYSARSIEMTAIETADGSFKRQQQPVVQQMVVLFRAHYGRSAGENGSVDYTDGDDGVVRRLDALSDQIQALSDRLTE